MNDTRDNMTPNDGDDRHAELRDLLDALRDGDLTEEQVARLDTLLEGDDEAQQMYVEYIDLYASLRHYHEADAAERTPTSGATSPSITRSNVFTYPPSAVGLAWWIGLAAALPLAVMITMSVMRAPAQVDQRPTLTDEAGLAVITRTVDTQWAEGTPAYEPGSTVAAGELNLDSGVVQIEFYSGATVVVEGPAEMNVISAERAVVKRGKVHATVPPQAHGFTLNAADVDVVDLGTEFALNVGDAGVTEVHVFDGEVELHDPSHADAKTRSLKMGDGVRIEKSGASTDIKPNSGEFVTPATLAGLADADGVRRRREWTRYTDHLRADPSVLLYFTFEDQQTWERRLLNRAVGRDDATPAPDASIIGAQWTEGRWPGKSALEFKRTSDRVRITVPGTYDSMTFAAWVRFDGFDRQWNSLMLTDGWKRGDPHWQVSWDGEMILGVNTGRTVNYFSPKHVLGPADLGRWLHLVTVYDGALRTTTHYLDGEVVSSERITDYIPLTINSAEMGNWQTTSRASSALRNLNGRIDEFTILGRAVDADEVQRMFNAGRP
ncbi:MAG: hypothetical protein GC159_02650 [Phycisphaera sp.]|nr:hypothetical protein [Phycisphaera sp.]